MAVAHLADQKSVIIFPNPSHGSLCVKVPTANALVTRIYSTTGKLVLEESLPEFSIEQLPKGMYIITVQTEDSVFTGKFFKE